MATRNMPEFENEAQMDLYCVRREFALVGQTQFIQSLEEGYAHSFSSDKAAVVVTEAYKILEALKVYKKKKWKKATTNKTKKPNITDETENSVKDRAVLEPQSNTDNSGESNHKSANKKSV